MRWPSPVRLAPNADLRLSRGEDWRLLLADIGEVAIYCPECAEREFGSHESEAARLSLKRHRAEISSLPARWRDEVSEDNRLERFDARRARHKAVGYAVVRTAPIRPSIRTE